MDSGTATGLIGLLLIVGYFLPTFVAAARQHPNAGAVIVIDLFLGWTFIGWVIALAMAVGRIDRVVGNSGFTGTTFVRSQDGRWWWDGSVWRPLPAAPGQIEEA